MSPESSIICELLHRNIINYDYDLLIDIQKEVEALFIDSEVKKYLLDLIDGLIRGVY